MMPVPVALRIAYDGACFDAYARDPGSRTVEGCLVEALRHQGFVEGTLRTGSRTDAGVSALENVCRVHLERPHLRGLLPALQSHLPGGLWATGAARVGPEWNPRHGACRQYSYTAVRGGEDAGRMCAAAAALVGRHDMRAFARLEPHRDPVRVVTLFTVEVEDGDAWRFTVAGPGFLWNQVRRMVAAVLAVGSGAAEVEDVTLALEEGVRHASFGVAPAAGLVLERVEYPGLEWDSAAGRVGVKGARRAWLEARGRLRVARHVRGLAEGGRGGGASGRARSGQPSGPASQRDRAQP